jgi:hypothetical protein
MREYVQLDIESGGEREPSFDEAIDRVERGSVSRRELLKMGGAFGAAFALAACSTRNSKGGSSAGSAPFRTASPTAHDARIVVIGAGLAGTTAAYRLSQQGLPVQLYEARDRIGGRCWTSREGWADAQTAEQVLVRAAAGPAAWRLRRSLFGRGGPRQRAARPLSHGWLDKWIDAQTSDPAACGPIP